MSKVDPAGLGLPILVGLLVPILLLLSGAFAKKLVRGTLGGQGWSRRDLFLGLHFTMAAVSFGFVWVADGLLRLSTLPLADGTQFAQDLGGAFFYSVVAFFLFVFVAIVHQEWEPKEMDRKGQILNLVVFTNAIGLLLVIAFMVWIKGVFR